MKMVARRAAGRADIADDVALFHMLARMDDEARHMAIARLDRVAMFDFDIIAIAAKALGAADGAVGGGVDGGAIGRRDSRSEERRVGRECVRKCRSRGSPNL